MVTILYQVIETPFGQPATRRKYPQQGPDPDEKRRFNGLIGWQAAPHMVEFVEILWYRYHNYTAIPRRCQGPGGAEANILRLAFRAVVTRRPGPAGGRAPIAASHPN